MKLLHLFTIILLMLSVHLQAEDNNLDKLLQRQAAFGKTIPQEKVYIHMDNTCYQLGDTIWFSAYTRRTDTGKPSDVSGVLYVELYGQDGYMIERKQIQMHEGHGEGFFDLNKQIQYAGFYELRAYTRWQLNWGLFEHPHPADMTERFTSKLQERDYYRDYEKLYSRVFPVYDKPIIPGEFTHDMTLRALRRAYDYDNKKHNLTLSLFPEGGNLVEGLPCRVAFEATWDNGEWAEGYLYYGADSVKAVHRGRGIMQVTAQKGMDRDMRFVSPDGKSVKVKLLKVESTGASMQLIETASGWQVRIRHTADLNADSMALSLMHEGKLVTSMHLCKMDKQDDGYALDISKSLLTEPGIYQATLFDTQGRVFADRLFFSRENLQQASSLSIEGINKEYQPYAPISLKLKAPAGKKHLSLSVKDDEQRDYLYDSGNILTEMLLSSEIRGLVPHPEWYFQRDDAEHHEALDLLMMTQGWRRFNWHDMAIRGTWEIVQPAEKTPILLGRVFDNDDWFASNGANAQDVHDGLKAMNKAWESNANRKELKVHAEAIVLGEETGYLSEGATTQSKFKLVLPPYYGKYVLFISVADTTKWKNIDKPYTWIQAKPYDEDNDWEEMPASRRIARLVDPDPADYLAKISWPYPRFVSPYTYYQNHLSVRPDAQHDYTRQTVNDTQIMQEITVRARRYSLKQFNDSWPIMAIDAEEAMNMEMDWGINFMSLMVNDYGLNLRAEINAGIGEPVFETRYGYGRTRRMVTGLDIPNDSLYARKYLRSGTFYLSSSGTAGVTVSDSRFYLSPGESREYRGNGVWDTYVLYSDYSPRMEGNSMYIADKPKTKLVQYPFADGSRRMTYRDRRYVLDGFAYPAEFYSPDYSKQKPDPEHADYRRTLYWNPNLQLDENGEATVTFYNNSRTTHLSVEAEGQAADGTLLWGKEE